MSSMSDSENDENILEFIERNKRKKFLEFKKQCFKEFSPLEVSIAKYLRLNCTYKEGVLRGNTIFYFTAKKLVDELMASKWGPGTDSSRTNRKCLFETRQACINFMQYLMNKQMFGRAVKIYQKKEPKVSAKSTRRSERERVLAEATKRSDDSSEEEDQQKMAPQVKHKPKRKTSKSSNTPDAKETKKKRKFKLEIHPDQIFVDAREPYIWMYNPPSLKSYIIGSLLIIVTIFLSLFPIWPKQLREGAYFLSITAASFMGATATLVMIKYILLVLVWLLTLGSIQFLIFPNLLKESNFFESFLPLYSITKACDKSSPKKSPKKLN